MKAGPRVKDRLWVAQVVCGEGFAGVERYVVNLSNNLAELGCDVFVLGGEPDRMTHELSDRQQAWWPAPGVQSAMIRLGRLGRLDIVHAHMTAAEIAVTALRAITRGRFVTTRHFAARRGTRLSGRLAAPPIRRTVDRQLAVSDYVASRIDGSSVVLRPGVPTTEPGAPASRHPVVLVAQRLETEKHTDLALRAWKRSDLGRSGWELHIVGRGSQEGPLRRLAAELGISQTCRFLGARTDIEGHYQTASLFFAPRPDEAFGLSVVEAMAAGLPVIAAAGGGHLETVGTCPEAAMFAPGDVDAAALLLRTLGADQQRRQGYGRELEALQRKSFDARNHSEAVLATYNAVATG